MDAGPYTASDPVRPDTPGPLPPASRRTGILRREQVYRDLRARVLAGEFPARLRLAEERLAALLDVSRTPIREALVRLHADGLVRHDPDGGYHVAEPDLIHLRDLYEVRIGLELQGLTRSTLDARVRHDPALLEPLRDAWRALREAPPPPDPAFVEVDEGFHLTVSQAAGNGVLTEMLRTVNARIRPVRMYDFLTADRIFQTIAQHLDIVEAVLAGDIELAVTELRRHVGISLEVVERRAARAITQMLVYGGGART